MDSPLVQIGKLAGGIGGGRIGRDSGYQPGYSTFGPFAIYVLAIGGAHLPYCAFQPLGAFNPLRLKARCQRRQLFSDAVQV